MHWFYPERYTVSPEGQAAVRECAVQTLRAHLDWLDAQLAERRWLLGGDERSGADLFLFMLTRFARHQQPAAWDRPHLGRHFRDLLARAPVRRVLLEQGLEVPQLR
jgi:glutathione S-transferase